MCGGVRSTTHTCSMHCTGGRAAVYPPYTAYFTTLSARLLSASWWMSSPPHLAVQPHLLSATFSPVFPGRRRGVPAPRRGFWVLPRGGLGRGRSRARRVPPAGTRAVGGCLGGDSAAQGGPAEGWAKEGEGGEEGGAERKDREKKRGDQGPRPRGPYVYRGPLPLFCVVYAPRVSPPPHHPSGLGVALCARVKMAGLRVNMKYDV